MSSSRLDELDIFVRRLARRLDTSLQNIDEQNFSNDYIARIEQKDGTIASLGASLDSVKNAKIGESRIMDAAISSAKIKRAAIDSVHIKDGAIGTAQIQAAAIGTANIQDSAITNAKIAELAVDSANIQDGAINSAKIKDAAITSAKIARLAVDTANIALGAIKQALIADGAVGSAQIADASITDAKIVELTANKITAGVLEVARLIITGENSIVQAINAENNTSEKSSSTIDGKAITKRSITADNIVASSITGKEIASNTITANNILANTITGEQIKGDTIESRHLKAGIITADKLESNIGAGLDISSNVSIINKVSTDDLNSRLGTITEQTMSYIQQEVKTLASDIEVNADALEAYKKEVRVWQRFSEQGLELGRSDSPFSVLLSAQRLSFRQNGAEIAYLANNKLYVLQGEISNLLTIGDSEDGYYDLVVKNKGLTLKLRG